MTKVNFTISEHTPEEYWRDYEEFIRLYNSNELRIKDIKKQLNLSVGKYRDYREKAIEENRLDFDTRKPQYYKKKQNKPLRAETAKHYHKCSKGGYTVSKSMNNREVYFGHYPTEDIAKQIVAKLKRVDWDKRELSRIQSEVFGGDVGGCYE